MDNKTLWIAGGGGLLLVLFLASRGSAGAAKSITGAPDPSVAQNVAGRWSFASSGFAGLAGATRAFYDDASRTAIADANLRASMSRDAAMVGAATVQANAQMASARAASRGRRGFSIGIPGIGALSIHF